MSIQCVPLTSQLRRRIAALARLSFDINILPETSADSNFSVEVNNINRAVIDLACAVLQDNPPTEIVPDLHLLQDKIRETAGRPGLTPRKAEQARQLCRHIEEMIRICNDPTLQDDIKHEHQPMPSYLRQRETVLLANGQLMAESFRLFLESFGIQVILGRESAGVVYGLTVGPLGEVDVKVSPETLADARILIDAMQKGYFVSAEDNEMLQTDPDDLEYDEDEPE